MLILRWLGGVKYILLIPSIVLFQCTISDLPKTGVSNSTAAQLEASVEVLIAPNCTRQQCQNFVIALLLQRKCDVIIEE